jgi:predicted phosphoadenosine phosphosulfate sulfurtransferase
MKKKYNNVNVYEASKERIRQLYMQFDTVVVAFSGGKDSTAALNVTIEVAREMGKLPVKTVFFDEECINFETIEFAERTMQRPEVEMYWYCVNIKHRNACSNLEPFWWSWDPTKKDLWVRPMPAHAITKIKGFNGIEQDEKTGIPYAFKCLFQDKELGKVVIVTGIRSSESLRRYRIMATRENDNYITAPGGGKLKNLTNAHPIYDWSAEDVWIAVSKFGWDYNVSYDMFNKTTMNNRLSAQRICAPFGEEPIRGLWIYKECFPAYWAKLCTRVKGVGAAVRYANTPIYSVGMKKPPEGLTWYQYTELALENYNDAEYKIVKKNIDDLIDMHYKKSTLDITEDTPDVISGVSWKFLCKIAIKGDFKQRIAGTASSNSEKTQKNLGLTFAEAVMKFGTKKYQRICKEKYPEFFNQ